MLTIPGIATTYVLVLPQPLLVVVVDEFLYLLKEIRLELRLLRDERVEVDRLREAAA